MAFVSAALAGAIVVSAPASEAYAADFTVERWRTVEITLTSSVTYADPFADVDVTATFTGPGGAVITRPAYWDGASTWRVRFAPTAVGAWAMTTAASNTSDSGLHAVSRSIDAIAYAGSLDVYKHGFVTPGATGRYLTYADGTPFFYLGDTHWVLPHERFTTSNAAGVGSQFKYTVDKRVQQGFTVYQSEPIWQPHGGTHAGTDEEAVADLRNGFSSADLAGFANLDRKFAYVADAGLVHANAQITWVNDPAAYPTVFTDAYMADLTRYWIARYGAYPVIWTIGQEIDANFYDAYDSSTMSKWFTVGSTLSTDDAYQHPIMPHQENTATTTVADSSWASKPYHDGFASQWGSTGNWSFTTAKQYWNASPTKPTIVYESAYEDFWTTSTGALSAAYKSFQLGMYGYGYGVAGVWNDVYSPSGQPLDAGTSYQLPARYQWWYDGANKVTADQLTYFRNFYTAMNWWELVPRFDDSTWSSVGAGGYTSSKGNDLYVVLLANGTTASGTVKQLDTTAYYRAEWFDPRTGSFQTISNSVTTATGTWTIPAKPSAADWVLRLTKGAAVATAVATPNATPVAQSFTARLQVALTTATSGAQLRYTIDGSAPTTSSPLYTAPITIAGTDDVTVRAQAFKAGLTASGQMTETFVAAPGLTAGGTYSSSSQSDSAQGAAKAFDADNTTNWQACAGCWNGQWVQVDFGSNRQVNTVTVSEYGNRTTGYRIEYWTGSAWATSHTGTTGFGNYRESTAISFPTVTTSKVRIFFTSGTGSAPIIYEFGAFRVLPPSLTIGAAVSASSQFDTNQVASKAFDGISNTNWQACSGCFSGQWLQADFGTSTTFNTVTVSEYANRTTGYRIEYWNGSTWATAYTGTTGFGTFGQTALISFPSVTGSKVRLYFTSGTGGQPIIYEFGAHLD